MPPIVRRLAPFIVGLGMLAMPAAASATASSSEIEAAKQAGIAYLKGLEQPNGSFSGFGGEWTLTALASAGVAGADVQASKGATDARSYYRELIGNIATWPGSGEAPVTDFETASLAAYAAGIDPARVSPSQNLIAQIFARRDASSPGYYGEEALLNGTIFALVALADTRTTKGAQRVPQSVLEQSVAVLRRNQHTDGGWGYEKAEGSKEALEAPAEAEVTGAAMAALCNAGVPASDHAISAAGSFLAAELDAEPLGSGAFETEFGPNTDSNAWAVDGLKACAISPQGAEFTTTHGKTPIDFLISQQLAGGGFRYEAAELKANLYSSQDAVRALAGGGFTAAPPKPKGAPRWVFEKKLTRGVPAKVALIIESAAGAPRACSATFTPSTSKATLASVLEAAEGASSPGGCVSAFTPTSGTGAITSLDGAPEPPASSWKVSIDGGSAKTAKRNTPVEIGDTIYLKLG